MDNIGIHRFRDLLLGEFSFTDDGQRWETPSAMDESVIQLSEATDFLSY